MEFLDGRCGLSRLREQALEAATGHVLELGGESGANLPLYPRTITSITSLIGTRHGSAQVRRTARQLPFSVDRREGALHAMPLKDHAYDTVVSTLALCAAPDPVSALQEIVRVLRPGGRLLLLEYALSHDARVARQQASWRWLTRRLYGHRAQPLRLEELLPDAGFSVRHLEMHFLERLPRALGCLCEGLALASG